MTFLIFKIYIPVILLTVELCNKELSLNAADILELLLVPPPVTTSPNSSGTSQIASLKGPPLTQDTRSTPLNEPVGPIEAGCIAVAALCFMRCRREGDLVEVSRGEYAGELLTELWKGIDEEDKDEENEEDKEDEEKKKEKKEIKKKMKKMKKKMKKKKMKKKKKKKDEEEKEEDEVRE